MAFDDAVNLGRSVNVHPKTLQSPKYLAIFSVVVSRNLRIEEVRVNLEPEIEIEYTDQ